MADCPLTFPIKYLAIGEVANKLFSLNISNINWERLRNLSRADRVRPLRVLEDLINYRGDLHRKYSLPFGRFVYNEEQFRINRNEFGI